MTTLDPRPHGAREPEDLEAVFGDPRHPGPLDFDAILADDAARRLDETAETLLDEWQAAAEFVPASLGGRWVSTEDLVRRLRPIHRRDPALGLGLGFGTFAAALTVWVAGDEAQRADAATRLLKGERIAARFDGLDLDDDLLGNGCSAEADGDRWVVTGSDAFVDADRAESMLIVARTATDAGDRSHSLLWWVEDPATRGIVGTGERIRTAGMRGCRLGGVEFRGLPVPMTRTVGAPGTAVGTALAAGRVSRAVLPALAVASVDSAVALAVRYSADRALYGGTVLDLPHARALLAGVIADLLIADAFASVVVRALHLAPEECRLLTAASAYLVPQLLRSAMQDLSVLFGSTFYARVEPYGVFEKFLRDLALAPFGHDDATACLEAILSDLPAWLLWSRRADAPAPVLFALGAPLGELDFGRLTVGPGASDPLGAALLEAARRARLDPGAPGGATLLHLVDEFDALRDAISNLSPSELDADAEPAVFDLAHRLTLFLAAGAWTGVGAGEGGSPITRDPVVLAAGLERLDARLRGRLAPLDETTVERLVTLATERADQGFGMTVAPARDSPGMDHVKKGTT